MTTVRDWAGGTAEVNELISGSGNGGRRRTGGYRRVSTWRRPAGGYRRVSTWRRRTGGNRRVSKYGVTYRLGYPARRGFNPRLFVPIAMPMALGLVLGMVFAMTGHHPTRILSSALGTSASTAAPGQGDATQGVTVAPGAQDQAGQDPAAQNRAAQDQAGQDPAAQNQAAQDQAGQDAPQVPPATASPQQNANMNCDVIVPPRPLSAAGLATPWLLTGPDGQSPAASGCQMSNPNLQAFVQATILDTDSGALSVYEPLVITMGTDPAVAPVTPRLPPHAVVNIMVGFNGNTITLTGSTPGTLANAHCVNGADGSPFGQVAYCNSVNFYAAARQAMAQGTLHVPANGISPVTGQPCPTTRSFTLVDQDPSDNVTTQYLLTADGRTGQDNAANVAALPGATVINNGSDNRLLDNFVLPALQCAPFTAPDLSAGGAPATSQTLDELSASVNQRAPVALVPENDPMTLVNGAVSPWKTDLYRLGVGQPLVFNATGGSAQPADSPATFCADMLNIQSVFIAANADRFATVTSPVPAMGSNLFTFLANRLSQSFTNLGCGNFGLHDPVTVTTDGHGVAVAAAFNLTPQVPEQGGQPAAPQQAWPAWANQSGTNQIMQWWGQLP